MTYDYKKIFDSGLYLWNVLAWCVASLITPPDFIIKIKVHGSLNLQCTENLVWSCFTNRIEWQYWVIALLLYLRSTIVFHSTYWFDQQITGKTIKAFPISIKRHKTETIWRIACLISRVLVRLLTRGFQRGVVPPFEARCAAKNENHQPGASFAAKSGFKT